MAFPTTVNAEDFNRIAQPVHEMSISVFQLYFHGATIPRQNG